MKSNLLKVACCAIVLLMAFSPAARGDIAYTLTDLGPIGTPPSGLFDRSLPTRSLAGAQAIDNSGRVFGNYVPAGATQVRGFVWSNGTMSDIGFLGSDPNTQGTYVTHIDSAGNAYGYSYMGASTTHLFAYRNGVLSDIDPQLSNVEFWGNNSDPTLVGNTMGTPSNPISHAVTYRNGTLTDLGTLGGQGSEAWAINDSGQVVGRSNPAGGSGINPMHAFLYSNGVMKDLGLLSSDFHAGSQAFAINASGQVIGDASVSPTLDPHAFLYSNNHMTDLGALGTAVGLQSIAIGLNNSGQVVGWSNKDTSINEYAFLYDNGAMKDLNSLIDPTLGWQLSVATGINDLGQIVGIGTTPSGVTHSYLLTPVPEPTACAASLLAISLWGLRGRRKTAKAG